MDGNVKTGPAAGATGVSEPRSQFRGVTVLQRSPSMLVLTRKSRQSVVVGQSPELARVLKITVLAIHGDRVSLGFEGDSEIMVNRLEVWERRLAASPTLPPVTPKE